MALINQGMGSDKPNKQEKAAGERWRIAAQHICGRNITKQRGGTIVWADAKVAGDGETFISRFTLLFGAPATRSGKYSKTTPEFIFTTESTENTEVNIRSTHPREINDVDKRSASPIGVELIHLFLCALCGSNSGFKVMSWPARCRRARRRRSAWSEAFGTIGCAIAPDAGPPTARSGTGSRRPSRSPAPGRRRGCGRGCR